MNYKSIKKEPFQKESKESKESAYHEKLEKPAQEKAERYTGHGFSMGGKHMGAKKPY